MDKWHCHFATPGSEPLAPRSGYCISKWAPDVFSELNEI